MWGIWSKTSIRTLDAKTHQYIRSTVLLENLFKTDKSQLKYKQISCWYGTFYVDYIKVGDRSVRQFIGETLYNNTLAFNTFFPCSNDTKKETVNTQFNELVGLSQTLHSGKS